MNNLDGQLLYDLTLRTSFSVKSSEESPYSVVINNWTEKALDFVKSYVSSFGTKSTERSALPLACHVWRTADGGPKNVIILTKSEGFIFTEENGFTDIIWKFELDFENNSSHDNNFFVLPIDNTMNMVLILDSLSHQCYLIDIYAKQCSVISLELTASSTIVGFWNLPPNFVNDRAVFILQSFGEWSVFSLNTLQSVLCGQINSCPSLTSAVFLPKFWLVVAGYFSGKSVESIKSGDSGKDVCFSSYRLSSEAPYLQPDKVSDSSSTTSLISRYFPFRRSRPDSPRLLAISPLESQLCVLHESGLLSTWTLPGLKLKTLFRPVMQRNFSEDSPPVADHNKMISQIFWWSEDSLLLSFFDGAFTVCQADTLHSNIGESAEWFEPLSVVSIVPEDASFIVQKQPQTPENNVRSDGGERPDAASVPVLGGSGIYNLLNKLIGFVFPRAVNEFVAEEETAATTISTFELWSFQKVTPEELFEIKLENEEYGDALILAKVYEFDTDLIHLRRWNKTPVSHTSIVDFLAKVANHRTAIKECMTRVADSFEGQRELLDFGLELTDPSKSFDDAQEQFVSLEQFLEDAADDVNNKLASIKTNQAEMLLWHFKITEYAKRLHLYESLLTKNTTLHYDPQVYTRIRDIDVFELAVEAARSGDVTFLEVLFAYYFNMLEPFRLLVVSNFPETQSPNEYMHLLPGRSIKSIGTEYDTVLDSDFTRLMLYGQAKYRPSAVDGALIEEMPNLATFVPKVLEDGSASSELTPEMLTDWFIARAEAIESASWRFDNAITLLGVGEDAGVLGLGHLLIDLKILSLLVYSCGLKTFSLSALRTSQPMDILKFLLGNSRKAQISTQLLEKHIKIWFQPYADLLESKLGSKAKLESIIVEFLRESIRNDVDFVVTVLRLCSRKESRLLTDPLSLLTSAVESIYACDDPDSVPLFEQIISYLPTRKSSDSLEVLKRYNEIDAIKILIEDLKILSKYGLPFTVTEIRKISQSTERCLDLLNQMMIHILKTATKDRCSNFFWTCVLADGLKLVDSFSTTNVTKDDFLAIYARHLLLFNGGGSRLGKLIESGSLVNMAKTVLTFSQAQASEKQGTPSLSYWKSARLAVGVANELFESAADLDDPALGRAQLCLDLVPKQYVNIDDELRQAFGEIQNYLEASLMMRQLDAPIVPLSLKVTGDRLGLLTNVVSTSSEPCLRNPNVFLNLAEILKVADNKVESRNLGLKLLASCAIGSGSLDAALGYCEQIVKADFAMAWQECAFLCELRVEQESSDEYNNAISDPSRLFPLLAFALAHCDSPNRMRSLVVVRQRIIADHCALILQPLPDGAGKVVDKVVTAVAKEIGDRTTSGLKQATSLLFNERFRPIVSLISQSLPEVPHRHKRPSEGQVDKDELEQLKSPKIDSFCNRDVTSVKQFIRSFESASDIALMLRLACISSSERPPGVDSNVVEKELEQHIIEIAKQLTSSYIDEDAAFVLVTCISLALSSGDADCLVSFLDVLSPTWPPSNPKMAIFSAYMIAFFLEKRYFVSEDESEGRLLNTSPVIVISDVYRRLSEGDKKELKKSGVLGERFISIIDMLFKLDESQSISKQLPPGINVEAFFADENYRSQVIQSMADDNFEQAIALAEHYQLPTNDVRLRFIKHTLLHSHKGDKATLVKEIVNACSPIANRDGGPSTLADLFIHDILAKIPGTNHRMIMFLFEIIEAVLAELGSSSLDIQASLPLNGHSIASLLCSNQDCFESMDFHELCKTPNATKILGLLESFTDDSSLKNIVKLIDLLPTVELLEVSTIYRQWSVKKFLMAVSHLQPVDIASIASAVASVEAYFVHMTPSDFAKFLYEIYSSDIFVKQAMPSSVKQALLKRLLQSLKTAKAKQSKDKSASTSDWSPAQDAFRTMARHLDRLNSTSWLQFEMVVDTVIYAEIRADFDRTLSREPALTNFVVDWLARLPVVEGGLGPEVVDLMLTCADFSVKTAAEAYPVCFRHQLSSNVDPSPLVLAVSKWSKMSGKASLVSDIFSSLREIVFSVIVHGKGGELLDATLSPKQRLQLLHHILDASGGQLNLSRDMLVDADFLYLQISACLQDQNCDITREDMQNESSRADFLMKIGKQLPWQCIVELVQILPTFNDPSIHSGVLMPLLENAATSAANSSDKTTEMNSFSCLVRELFTDKRISAEEIIKIASIVAALGFHSNAIIICLISSVARESPVIFEYLSNYEAATLNIRQPLLCSELLECGMLPKFAQTPFFVPLVDYAVFNQAALSFSLTQLSDQLSGFSLDEEVEFLRRRATVRSRFGEGGADESDASGSLLSSVSGAFRKWF